MANLSKWFPFKFKRTAKPEDGGKTAAVAKQPAARREGWPMMSAMHPMMQSMFSADFWRDPFAALGNNDRFFGDFTPMNFNPSVDIVDEGSSVKVLAELPGMDKSDIQLQVHEGTLTISGEKKHEENREEEGCYRTERYYGSFRRNIPLPLDIDSERAEAQFDKGVLTVAFPKAEQKSSAKTIDVK